MAWDIIRRKQVEGDWTMGASFMTSSEDAKQKWNGLIASVDNLNVDITQVWFPRHRDEELAKNFVNAWIRWRDTVYSEYKDNARVKILPDLAWSVWNRGDAKLRELEEWRAKFEALSGQPASAPSSRPEERHETRSPGTSPWAWVAAAAGGAALFALALRKVS